MANDLISRQAAIEAIGKVPDYGDGMVFEAISHAQRDVALLPSVDAVSVVRCGECKHLMTDGRCFEFADDNIRPSVSDYCSHGERREE